MAAINEVEERMVSAITIGLAVVRNGFSGVSKLPMYKFPPEMRVIAAALLAPKIYDELKLAEAEPQDKAAGSR